MLWENEPQTGSVRHSMSPFSSISGCKRARKRDFWPVISRFWGGITPTIRALYPWQFWTKFLIHIFEIPRLPLVLLFAPWFSFAWGVLNFYFRIFHLWIFNYLYADLQMLLDFSFVDLQMLLGFSFVDFQIVICGFANLGCIFHLWNVNFVDFSKIGLWKIRSDFPSEEKIPG